MGWGHPLLRDLAVLGEREHRLDQLLEAERGGDLAHEVGGLVADVLEPVRRPGRDEHAIAGLRDDRVLADAELQLAGENLEELLLGGVHVRRSDCAVRLDECLDDDTLAVRVGGRRAEHESLAGDAVRDGLAGGDHFVSLFGLDLT